MAVPRDSSKLTKKTLKSMELQGGDGSKLELQIDSEAFFGRGRGFETSDRTVSREHLLLRYLPQKTGHKVSIRVLGKNPVWVLSGDGEIRVLRRSGEAELVGGDGFCVSGKRPVWFRLKEIEVSENVESGSEVMSVDPVKENLKSESELESIDVSTIDPVKEFGFLVLGHEFDSYPKHMIRDIKNWDWFLEEPKKGSDDEEDDAYEKRKRKRVQGKSNVEDDDWTGESEDDEKLVNESRKTNKAKYSTRSKDQSRNPRNASTSYTGSEEDDDDDETLRGFIVGDEDSDRGEDSEETDQEEEEEFLEDEEMDE